MPITIRVPLLSHEPAREPYVVTWWEGEIRQHRVLPDEISAGMEQAALKQQSMAMETVSLEPIRRMSERVWRQMETIKTIYKTQTCRHAPRLLRLCVPCLEAMITHDAA